MVQRTQVVLEDDVDGGAAEETVQFALDGTSYEIDLNSQNAEKLREALAPWVGHARRTAGARKNAGSGRASARGGRVQANDVRVWARDNGYTVSDRGRVPAEVREAYDRAH